MLENNRLYRRIQTNNPFRTFSRTYARSTAFNNSQSCNSEKLAQTFEETQKELDRSGVHSCLGQRRTVFINTNTLKNTSQGHTAPPFGMTEPSYNKKGPFSRTFDVPSLQSKLNKTESYSGNPYLNSTISNKKQGCSLLINLR